MHPPFVHLDRRALKWDDLCKYAVGPVHERALVEERAQTPMLKLGPRLHHLHMHAMDAPF